MTRYRCPSLKDTKLILLFTLCHIYPYIRFRRVMWFHYALTLEREAILPLDSEEVGKGGAEASFFLSSGE